MVSRQILEDMMPVVFAVQNHRVDMLTVLHQMNFNLHRAICAAVVVVPHLDALKVNQRGRSLQLDGGEDIVLPLVVHIARRHRGQEGLEAVRPAADDDRRARNKVQTGVQARKCYSAVFVRRAGEIRRFGRGEGFHRFGRGCPVRRILQRVNVDIQGAVRAAQGEPSVRIHVRHLIQLEGHAGQVRIILVVIRLNGERQGVRQIHPFKGKRAGRKQKAAQCCQQARGFAAHHDRSAPFRFLCFGLVVTSMRMRRISSIGAATIGATM